MLSLWPRARVVTSTVDFAVLDMFRDESSRDGLEKKSSSGSYGEESELICSTELLIIS